MGGCQSQIDTPISIEGSDQDCDENEYLFDVKGKENGVVSFDLALGEEPLTADNSFIWYSKDRGEEDAWEPYDPGDLTDLSSEGSGYIKVQLLSEAEQGKSLNAQVTQYDIELEDGQPVIDVQYQMLNFDGAVPVNASNWQKSWGC